MKVLFCHTARASGQTDLFLLHKKFKAQKTKSIKFLTEELNKMDTAGLLAAKSCSN